MLAVWIARWITGRRIGLRFYLSAAAGAVSSIPAGLLFAWLQGPCHSSDQGIWACGYSEALIVGVLSAVLSTGCLVGLLLLTAFLRMFGLGPGSVDQPHPER